MSLPYSARRVFLGFVLLTGVIRFATPVCEAQIIIPSKTVSPSASTNSTTRPGISTLSDKQQAALDLALETAEAGIEEVSLEAVRRVLKAGKAVSAGQLGGLLSSSSAVPAVPQGIVFSGSIRVPVATASQTKTATIATRLEKINIAWKKAGFDPKNCYQVWKLAAFPKEGSGSLFANSPAINQMPMTVDIAVRQPKRIRSCADYLVDWAKLANAEDELRAELEKTSGKMVGGKTAQVVAIMLAKDNPEQAKLWCKKLEKNLDSLFVDQEAMVTSQEVFEMLKCLPADSPEKRQLWNAITARCQLDSTWARNEWLRYAVAKRAEEAASKGDADSFTAASNLLLSILDPIRANNADYVADKEAAYYRQASQKAFEGNHIELGIACLSELSGRSTSTLKIPDGLLVPRGKFVQYLIRSTPEVRYELLAKIVWAMEDLGLIGCSRIAPTDEIPARFINESKERQGATSQPYEIFTDASSSSYSLLELVMRDAIRLGKQSDIEKSIKAAQANNGEYGKLASFVWQKVKGDSPDLSPLMESIDNKQVIRREITGRGPLLPIDFEIARVALQSEGTREQGIEFANRLAARGLSNTVDDVLQGRMLAGKGMLDAGNTSSSKQLKHFLKADDYPGNTLMNGFPNHSLWLEEEAGNWEHYASSHRSSLMVKYPLHGKFDITFRGRDDLYAECGATFGGVYFDFRGYLNDIALEGIGKRSQDSLINMLIKRGSLNSYRLSRDSESGTLDIYCEDTLLGTLKIGKDEFPFFGLQAMRHRQMTLQDISIEGEIEIPSSLPLLTPSLHGWSAHFKYRSMPPTGFLKPQQSGSQKKSDLPFDWHLKEGELQSVDHATLRKIDREKGLEVVEDKYEIHESWVYYLRPLCDGEELEFEFFHEPGRFSLNPTIDRIAVSFQDNEIKQHWITSDGGIWYGVDPANSVSAPKESVVQPYSLKEADWNQATFKRRDNEITLSINGVAAYRQKVDPKLDGRLGFFHDPTKFQVRVRNVKLSGDWPSELPKNLFEKVGP